MNVVAVVVTYNRLTLLKEAVAALQNQTHSVSEIIVVNNNSTDGTTEWLTAQKYLHVIHQQNTGGSGGFYTGIKYCAKLDADWIWLMDDDTICRPDALEKMLQKSAVTGNAKVGFINSKCIWTDGTPHFMNLVDIKPYFNKETPYNLYDEHNLLLTEMCSFVSVLINIKAVLEAGLPYKEFFIWGDDQEYTKRITELGYLGLYCSDSIVLHKTPNNYHTNIYTDSLKNLWKYGYGFRNEFFLIKKRKGLLYFILFLPAKILYSSYKIIKLRKDHKLNFISVLLKSSWSSIFFNPKAEKLLNYYKNKYQFFIRFKHTTINSAATKPMLDCNKIFSLNGYKDFTLTFWDNSDRLKYYISLFKGIFNFFFSVKSGSAVVIQYPLSSINNVFKYFIIAARLKKVKFFCIVHDLESLRSGGKNTQLTDKEVLNLNFYDAIIAHNLSMMNWLKEKGVNKSMIPLGVFDYLLPAGIIPVQPEKPIRKIAFAGNLDKSSFIYLLYKIKKWEFNIYGPNFNHEKQQQKNVAWCGEFSPEDIAYKIKGDFGLIWDGERIDLSDEILGNYLKYIDPHKFSLYMAAGIPVIAPKNSAIGIFIGLYKIGLLIDNLYDLDNLNVTEEQYKHMVANIMNIQDYVVSGDYLTNAIHKAEAII